jgi:transcriptional regulator with XRE-family HTH domain
VITAEDWAEIRRLYRSEKLSQAEFARRLKLSHNTVGNAVHSESPPRYERAPVASSAWLQVEPRCGRCCGSTRLWRPR